MDDRERNISICKSNGRFYTPKFIVENILDLAGYCGVAILKKHVMENSCGDGAFLSEIVARYCKSALAAGMEVDEIAQDLSVYIHGIEIDEDEQKKCVQNVTRVARAYGVYCANWDIRNADAMTVRDYDGKMDFVLGNPPYVRVHKVGEAFDRVKQFAFSKAGMTDLYIVFYEIGLQMLNKNGVLGYITPSSFFNSLAGAALRDRLIKNDLIDKLVDLKHFQAFAATTYTTIVVLKKNKTTDLVQYYQYDETAKAPYFVDELSPRDFYICNNFYFANRQALCLLRKIFYNFGQARVAVKNGYATLCDDVFVGNFDFESPYIIPVVKASTGKGTKIFYPYGKDARPIAENELKHDEKLYAYLLAHRSALLKRSCDVEGIWYSFGRSQAINDTYKDKLAINTLVRDEKDLKIVPAPAGVGVYGGLYIVGDTAVMQKAQDALMSNEFAQYVALLGKYKSGGYYTFSSKDVKAFLDYKLAYDGGLLS